MQICNIVVVNIIIYIYSPKVFINLLIINVEGFTICANSIHEATVCYLLDLEDVECEDRTAPNLFRAFDSNLIFFDRAALISTYIRDISVNFICETCALKHT